MSVFRVLAFKEQFISDERLPPALPYFVEYWQLVITAVIFCKAGFSNSQQVVLKFPSVDITPARPLPPTCLRGRVAGDIFTLSYYIWTAQFLIGALSI